MTDNKSAILANLRKPASCKPPVPARPKNLVVLNSKTLPKPPENVLTGNVTNFIKALNLDSQDEKTSQNPKTPERMNATTPNSDEEDIDGYLEPVSLSFGSVFSSDGKRLQKNHCDESEQLRPVPKNVSNSIIKEKDNIDDDNKHGSHSHRPLPLPPVSNETEVTSMPWYKNVDRKKGEELLKGGVDGYFLVRPSSKEDTYFTLTLWFHNRLYNIPIRKRRDGKYALGTPKTNEKCFESIEEMVKNYQSEKLLLYSNGSKAGRTLLTIYPP